MYTILGLIGILNIIASIYLIIKNNIIGWISLFPIILLLYSPFSAMLGLYLINTPDGISIFNRILFSIPANLSLSYVVYELFILLSIRNKLYSKYFITIIIYIILITPYNKFGYNRIYNSIVQVPDDLAGLNWIYDHNYLTKRAYENHSYIITSTNSDILFKYKALGFNTVYPSERVFWFDKIQYNSRLYDHFYDNINNGIYIIDKWDDYYTPYSINGLLSGHWIPTNGSIFYAEHK